MIRLSDIVSRFRFFRPRDPKTLSDREFAVWAEGRACKYLKRRGMRILARNHRTPTGEIDVVGSDGNWLVFVEVKAERSSAGQPELKVTPAKQKRLLSAAKAYISKYRLHDQPARFDIVTIKASAGGEIEIDHQPDAFEAK